MKESFGSKDKVSSHEKLVFRSGVQFLFLFVLMDAILRELDLQKRTNDLDTEVVCLRKLHHISENWERIFHFHIKVAIGQCESSPIFMK